MAVLTSDTLYIRIGQKAFIFASYDEMSKQNFEYVHYKLKPEVSPNANMHEALKRVAFVRNTFHKVKVLVEGAATLVPLNEFDEEDSEALYFFNISDQQKRRRVFYDTLPRLGAVLLFGIDKDLCHTLEETFANIYFQSTETSLILHFASCCPYSKGTSQLYVCMETSRVSVAAYRNGRIDRYNTFVLYNVQEALYYVLSMVKTCRMDAANDEIHVSGAEGIAERLVEKVKPFYPNCHINLPQNEFGRIGKTLHAAFPYDMVNALLKAY